MTGANGMLRIAAGALAAAWFAAPAPAHAAYAIAFNPQNGRAGASNVSWDLAKTRRDALSKCGSGCRIVSSGKKTCAAVVESISTGTSAWAVATGTTTSTAANAAWHGCRRKGGVTCKTAAAICD
ncbi:MAG: DUF4189 domain-containing protein [Variibacter sp.]|nr:DUF4189 domain-containing protein [Variibacter sp.]